MSLFSDLLGTTAAYFKIGLQGVRLKNNSGNLSIRNTGDTSDAEITTAKVNISGDSIVVNSDSVGTGSDYKITIQRPASGMSGDMTITLPTTHGSAGQVLSDDGTGVWSWVSSANTALATKEDTTTVGFGSSSPITMFTTGIGDVIDKIKVIVDTPFNGTAPTLTIGIVGQTSKYLTTQQADLKTATSYEVNPVLDAQGVENLITTYVSDGSSAGSARIIVFYATPA